MSKLLLISIKEKYVLKIISGEKTIELRKSMPKVKAGDTLIIYTTQPRKAVTAVATVKRIIKLDPEEMWAQHKNSVGVVKEEFNKYYENCTTAVGIELCQVFTLDAEILLSAIKMIHPHFTPPQTFKYLDKFQTLRDYKNLSN